MRSINPLSRVEINALTHAFAVFETFTGNDIRRVELLEPVFTKTELDHMIHVRISLLIKHGLRVYPTIPLRFKTVEASGFYLATDYITELAVIDPTIGEEAIRYPMKFDKDGRVLIDKPGESEPDTILTGRSYTCNLGGYRKHKGEFPRYRGDGTPG